MIKPVPSSELQHRMIRLREEMDRTGPDWDMVVLFSKINLFYFTGTMQDGMLLIPRNGDAIFWVRRSYDRALEESLFSPILSMESFRDAAAASGPTPEMVHMETEIVPIALLSRFRKYFPARDVKSADRQIAAVRAVKSAFELERMESSGRIHERVLEERAPALLREGISETMFASQLYPIMVEEGHHGIVRFGMFETEILLGQIAFGENSLYPTYFNGPGGSRGLCPAVPLLGDSKRTLKTGDLVFVDIGCGVDGYHTDKTMTYIFRDSLPEEAILAHEQCVQIQNRMAKMLRPGAVPSEIYSSVIDSSDPAFLENFMGYGGRPVKFLGHSIGLLIDELPVIAKGFDEPLTENMVFALEPKKGIKGVGMVGIENTFVVTPSGGRCITGTHPGLMLVE